MKNKLQYAYSISVFVGVLLTAYMMMNQEAGSRLPNRNLSPGTGLRTEAQVGDPAVRELLDVEDALAKAPAEEAARSEDKRTPSQAPMSPR